MWRVREFPSITNWDTGISKIGHPEIDYVELNFDLNSHFI